MCVDESRYERCIGQVNKGRIAGGRLTNACNLVTINDNRWIIDDAAALHVEHVPGMDDGPRRRLVHECFLGKADER